MLAALLTLPHVLAGFMVIALNAYVLFGGADYGGGVWDLFAAGPRRQAQRELVADAIGPIWEANHVWLILVVVLLFTCFPPAFATLAVGLHVPLTLMLVGIVLRGSAFTFRTYDSQRDAVQRRWGTVFAVASVLTPVLLGACIGAVTEGAVGDAARRGFLGGGLWGWLTPFSLGVGALALALFAFLAATYLTVEAEGDAALQDDFRARALAAGAAVFVTALGVLVLSWTAAPHVRATLLTTGGAGLLLQGVAALAAITALASLWTRRYRLARLTAAAQVSCILWGWAWAQFPYLVPRTLTITAAAAPPITLRLVLVALAGGSVLLLPSLWYLFRVFKGSGSPFRQVEDAGH